jgi:hypothetical protein
MINEEQLRRLEYTYASEDNCRICGTTNGIHKLVRREDGSYYYCGGGDLHVLVKEVRRLRERICVAQNNLNKALGEEKT